MVVVDLSQQEKLVDQYVKQDNKEGAVKLLFDLIVTYAKKKDFAKAEVLREKLYEIDSMALNEIVRSGEIIEEEKSESIDQDHLVIWSKLYDTLSGEEANALYYAMKEAAYDVDETIFEQGERNSNLYFINQGQLKLVYSEGGGEVLLKTLSTGHIAGEDTFFFESVCTTSMITLSRVKLNFLEKDALSKWGDEFPGLESRLNDYCRKLKRVRDLLKAKNLDRRSQKRVNVSGKGMIQLLGASGKPLGRAFKGELSDISVGGLSYTIRISKKETARLLLGRKMNIKFVLPVQGSKQRIDKNGTAIGVRSYPFDDYSIHIKFDKLLDEKLLLRR
jgi:CRP-like cAMP-binding protein